MANNKHTDDWVDVPVQDDWQDVPTEPSAPQVSTAESALRGAAQGASMGFADEATGGLEALKEVALSDAEIGDLARLYRKYRDESRANYKAAEEANPVAYGAGQVAGGMATMAIPGLNVTKGASLVNAGVKGAIAGGLTGAGMSEKEGLESLQDAALPAATGAVLGAGAQKVGQALSKAPQTAGDALQDFAEVQSARAMGLERGTLNKMGMDRAKSLGRAGLDKGIVTPLASTDDMLARAEALKATGGAQMGQAFDAIDNAGASTFNPLNVASSVDEQLGGFYRSPINRGETQQLENMLESIVQRGADDIPLREAQALKEEIGKVAFPNGGKINPDLITEKQRMAQEAYRIVNEAIDNAAAQGGEALGDASVQTMLREGKDLYGAGANASKLLANRQAKEAGNKMFGLTDTIVGASGLVGAVPTGGMSAVAGAAVVGAKKLAEKYGPQTMAVGADKLGDFLKRDPFAFGRFSGVLSQAAARGGNSLAATHYLLQQQDPEYRETVKRVMNNEEGSELP